MACDRILKLILCRPSWSSCQPAISKQSRCTRTRTAQPSFVATVLLIAIPEALGSVRPCKIATDCSDLSSIGILSCLRVVPSWHLRCRPVVPRRYVLDVRPGNLKPWLVWDSWQHTSPSFPVTTGRPHHARALPSRVTDLGEIPFNFSMSTAGGLPLRPLTSLGRRMP